MKVKLTPIGRFGRAVVENVLFVTITEPNKLQITTVDEVVKSYNLSEWAALVYEETRGT